MFKKTSYILLGFTMGAASLVYAANIWQGTTSIDDGQVITAEVVRDNFDYLYARANILDSIPVCTGGDKALGWNGSAWTCDDVDSSTTATGYGMAFGVHTEAECVAEGGVVFDTGSTLLCRFDPPSSRTVGTGFSARTVLGCPAGWTQYQNWSATTPGRCAPAYGSSCNTSSHGFGNQAVETCFFQSCRDTNKGCGQATCSAGLTEIGCY